MAINQTLQHKRSTVSGNVPSTAQVAIGELAINLADKSIYTKNAAGVIIELAADVLTGAAFLGTPNTGDMWYNTTTDILSAWDGTSWVPVSATGKSVLPGNTTSRVGFSGGSGTSASPYTFSVTASVGSTAVIDTITVTGLNAGQYVPIVDLNSATNGGRFSVNNNFADSTGTLVFTITFTDSPSSAPSTAYTAAFQVGTSTVYINPTTTVVAVFPQSVNQPTNTLAISTSWTAPADTLTATGQMRISLDNVTYGTGPLSITTGATLWTKWNGNAGSGVGIDSAHGTTITGAVVSSNGGTASSSLTIDKTPAAITFTAQTSVALNTLATSNTVTISGVNSYVYLTSANTMTAAIGGGSYTSVPASGTSLYAINGNTISVGQTSSSSPSTATTVTLTAGGTSAGFTVTTGNNTVVTPSITTPTTGATGISPTATIVSSAYAVTGTVGTHASSDWQIYGNAGLTILITSSLISTTNLTTWTPSGLSNSTQYWVRVRYRSSDGIVSSWSTASSWTTSAQPGITWTSRSSGVTDFLSDVNYANGKWVIVGWNSVLLTSNDGISWSTPTWTAPLTSMYFEVVTYANGLWVAGSRESYYGITTSTDGINWTTQDSTFDFGPVWDIAYGNGNWITVADTTIRISSDATNWTTVNGVASAYRIIYANNIFMSVGGHCDVNIYSSGTWTTLYNVLSSPADWKFRGVAYGNGKWVAVGYDASLRGIGAVSSDNGQTWTQITLPTAPNTTFSNITYDNGLFVIPSASLIYTSPDGTTWTSYAVSGDYSSGVKYSNGLWVAIGNTGGGSPAYVMITSPDAVTWTQRTTGVLGRASSLSYGNGEWVVVGSNGKILTSP